MTSSEANEHPPLKVYGGVSSAVEAFNVTPVSAGVGAPMIWPLATFDVVGSAIFDTLSLPITLCSWAYKSYNSEDYMAKPKATTTFEWPIEGPGLNPGVP